jgi:hypothetical protein
VCYALAQLAAGFKDADSTSLFSPYFKDIVAALLEAVRGCARIPLLITGVSCWQHAAAAVLHQHHVHQSPARPVIPCLFHCQAFLLLRDTAAMTHAKA